MDKYNFRGNYTQYGNYLWTDQLEINLISWLNWALLGIGAFENIHKDDAGVYGGDRSRLRAAIDPRYATNKVWQAHRPDWCWESGIAYGTQPIHVSGVWVNNSFYPTTGSTYAHYIDYPLGRVVFSSAIPATSIVQVEYSPKYVNIRRSDDPWFKQVMNGSLRVDDTQFTATNPSGQWTALPEQRLVLPALIIEPALHMNSIPYEMGNTSRIHEEDFLVHVIAENPFDRNILTSLLKDQSDKRIIGFDRNRAPMPLDIFGSPTPSAMTYPQLCEAYDFPQISINKVVTTNQEPIGNKIWWTTTRLTLELDVP